MSKKIVFIADLHVGHRVALADPSDAPTNDVGAPIRERFYEKYLWCTESEWSSPDVLAVLGDAVDGKGRHTAGTEQWDTSTRNQALHAAKLLRLWNANQYIVIRGSHYHVSRDGEQDEELMAQELGATVFPHQEHIPERYREKSGFHCYLTVEGVSFHLAHKMPVSKVFHYRATPITREMMYQKLNDGLRKIEGNYETKNIIRAHCHFYWGSASSSTLGLALPCFQALTPYMQSSSPTSISPDIGFVGFEVEDGKILRQHNQLWAVEHIQKPPHIII